MLVARRLASQHLTSASFSNPVDVVSHFGAVQAQDYAACKWAIASRLDTPTTDAAIEKLFDDGKILRTHAFRGTWQLIAPSDIRWILFVVGALVNRRAAPRY